MANNTAIEWTEATWNPIVGCSILSPGCIHCYAMPEAARQIRCAAGHYDDGPDVWRFGKKAAGRLLDGVEHNGFPTTENLHGV